MKGSRGKSIVYTRGVCQFHNVVAAWRARALSQPVVIHGCVETFYDEKSPRRYRTSVVRRISRSSCSTPSHSLTVKSSIRVSEIVI